MRPPDLCKRQGKQVLLVEGSDDCHVILALCEAHRVPETFGVYECGGSTEVLKRLNALILQPDAPEIIGVVLDADTPDTMTRWSGIRSKSELRRYPLPDIPQIDGTIITGPDGKPKLGFWLMPKGVTSRALCKGYVGAHPCVRPVGGGHTGPPPTGGHTGPPLPGLHPLRQPTDIR